MQIVDTFDNRVFAEEEEEGEEDESVANGTRFMVHFNFP